MDSQSSEIPESPATEIAHRRLHELLERLSQEGLTQNQAAAKASLPPQYLSDVKNARRPLTELVARRLGAVFNVNHEWLLGTSDSAESFDNRRVWLPLFSYPIYGAPREHPQWDGKGIEICGPAMALLSKTTQPYVFQFGNEDASGRLRKGDLILMSQAINPVAEISAVQVRKKCFLARKHMEGTWLRVAPPNKVLPATCLVAGHCVGIIWSSLR